MGHLTAISCPVRSNALATIVRRGAYQWQAKVRRRTRSISKTFTSRGDAERWAIETEAEITRGVFRDYSASERITLFEILERYQEDILPGKRSQASVVSQINRLKKTSAGTLPLINVTPDLIAQIRDDRLKEVCSETARKDILLLKRVFNVVIKDWGIALPHGNPADEVRLPPPCQQRNRRLHAYEIQGEDDEETRLLKAAKKYGGYIHDVIVIAIETGMRRGEIAAMQWRHIDREARVLSIPDTKTGTPRRIPLSSRALAVLEGLPRREDRWIWSVRPDSITQAFDRVCDMAGINDLRFHDPRHEATSRFFEIGLNIMEVSAITGHKTLQMLKRYTQLRAEDLVERLN